MIRRTSCTAAIAFAAFLFASPPAALAEWDVDGIEELLPRAETPAELAVREELLRHGPVPTLRADLPPTPPVRNCAEWEPAAGVLIRYPLGLPYNLLRDFDDVTTIYVVLATGQLSGAQTAFVANGVDTTKVEWLVKPTDSIWTRDYGPWFVFDGNGDIAIVDHVYNRPSRPNDDLTPVAFGAQFGYPVIRHDMWHTGGNYMTDGSLLSMSTDLVYDEALSANGLSPAQVDALMNDYYGIGPYNVVNDIQATGIHHIDTWGKFLDEETVLVKRPYAGHSTVTACDQRATLIASLPASTGRNYSVFRVDCHNLGNGTPASYTNSLILNDRIYVPTFSSAANDTAAMNAYRAAIPGYDVRPYNYNGFITDDALHCRAMGIMDPGMLRVAHAPIREEQEGPVTIAAFVDDRSESGISAVELHYRFAAGSWTSVAMTPAGGDDYEGEIPNPPSDTTVDYYIHAADLSGREAGMPRPEPAAWYSFPITSSAVVVPEVASGTAVGAPHPNPFAASTSFSFELKYPDRVELTVHDVSGRLVRTLAEGDLGAGTHRLEWDARDDAGVRMSSGVYFFRLRAAGLAYSRPVTLVR